MNEMIQTQDTISIIKDTVASAISSTTSDLPDLQFKISNITSDNLILTVLGYTIVFLALLFLFITFLNVTKLLNYKIKKKLQSTGKEETESKIIDLSGEVAAAISTALLLHFREVHDFENTIITMKKVQKPYSPWSSKIYGLRQYPGKR